MFRRRPQHHYAAMLAEAFGVGVKEQVKLVELLQVEHAGGVKHRALHLDGGRCLEGRRGGGDGVGGAEQLLYLSGEPPCPGDNHRVGQTRLATAMPLQRQGLRQADGPGQATAPRGIDEGKVAVTHR